MTDSDDGVLDTSLPYESPLSNLQPPSDNNELDSQKPHESRDDTREDESLPEKVEKPLLQEETVKIEIHSDNEVEDTPTLSLPDKKRKSKDDLKEQKAKLPIYLFPFIRMKDAWNESSNVFQFLGTVTCIIFQTVGWLTCVGGVPFLSLVMLIIGSIYVHDCKIEPNIPVYLIVSGVIGTIQHFLTIWTKYVPKDSKGRLKVYRSYCRVLNGLLHLFLMIWFVLGCIWIYGSYDNVEFEDPSKDEYCQRTLYYFTFWIFNLSFILLGLLLFLSMCFLIFIVAADNSL